MRLPDWSLPRVGRRLGRALLALSVVLAGAATAVALGATTSSSDEGVASMSKLALRPQPIVAPAIVTVAAPPARTVDRRERGGKRKGKAEHYRRIASRRVPASAKSAFMPLYREAARTYGIDWRLVASVHNQETAFSTAPSTYRGLNAFGCCAGPMQFNVTNGPPSTWDSYRQAFRDGTRPKRYPHRSDSHPSIYDDFDAIMAAGSLLRDSGADSSLEAGSWGAAYAYYGRDLFGVTYANQVLARATTWKRGGFCVNCGLDEGLVAQFEADYGAAARRQLIDAEARSKQRERRKRERKQRERRQRERERLERERKERRSAREDRDGGSDDRRPGSSPAEGKRPAPPPAAKDPAATAPPPSTTPSTTPSPPSSAPPAGDECNEVSKLLGC